VKDASLSLGSKGSVTDASKKKLQDFWRNIRYLIIDEYSMLSKTFLATLSRNITIGMEGSSGFRPGQSFGGLNIILCGDLHQFPPVACGKREALYYPISMKDPVDAQIGWHIYEEFTTVVILKEQMRVTDQTWRDFLVHLRYKRVETRHLDMLRTLVLKRPPASPAQAGLSAISSSVITPSYSPPRPSSHNPNHQFQLAPMERRSFDYTSTRRQDTLEPGGSSEVVLRLTTLFVHLPSTRDDKRSTVNSRGVLCSRQSHQENAKRRHKKDLPETIHLAIGMKVMVTNNLQTDLDITNGARGVIVDIILSHDEPPLEEGFLQHQETGRSLVFDYSTYLLLLQIHVQQLSNSLFHA